MIRPFELLSVFAIFGQSVELASFHSSLGRLYWALSSSLGADLGTIRNERI